MRSNVLGGDFARVPRNEAGTAPTGTNRDGDEALPDTINGLASTFPNEGEVDIVVAESYEPASKASIGGGFGTDDSDIGASVIVVGEEG